MNKKFNTILKCTSILLPLLAASCGSSSNVEKAAPAEEKNQIQEKEAVPAAPTAAELYAQKYNGITLSVTQVPAETKKAKEFNKPYIIKATKSETSTTELNGLPVTVQVPDSYANGRIKHKKHEIFIGEDGTASFLPEIPSRAFNDYVFFYPSGNTSDEAVAEKAAELTVKAPYKVQTNLKTAGGVIGLIDFSQTDKPILSNSFSSSNLLMNLMKMGFVKIGNIDVAQDVLNDDPVRIQKSVKAKVGNTAAFVIYGTVKYDSVEKIESGTAITLKADMKCMDLRSGEILCSAIKTVSVTEKSEWTALNAARNKLSEELAQTIKYGL